ncbi:cell division control protein Cdc6 [Haloferax sp. Atlit-6N]|uniref:ORC1-type DNA replication protein n=2 Tax=Haloferax gibbonsii TaxID=35746 RepID=A0A871BAD8_HALGI|nr:MULTISPECIES: ORC1-type DNA replication protein [Haloferax]ELZ81971.1 Orc1-type DNA replication protein [Haloferax gibbonsii ATCC 33959]QOS10158.1 Orc1-type DNA replication protein [Haloferax gibbonsii]RDZ54024.1 cell division control protein Cdc6 [Haloferax sp. Atlit-4N]REA06318.1 cell division control protein Cdc6 [Haloferax sp. Atlit-6N]
MDEEENPRGGARGEVGNSTSDDSAVDGDSGDAPSTDASADDASSETPTPAAEDDVSPEDIDIQASIGPDADAPDEDLDQHKDPDVGLDKVVLNDDEGSKGLFDDLLAGEPIFENKEVLRPSYTPHELPHRTDQINQMATILVSALRGETPSNILIYGKTGTGKTASAKFVSQELESTSQKYDVPCEVEYINCEVTDTQYRVLAQLANKFIEKNVERIEAEQERLDEMRTRATEDPNALADTPYDSIAEIDERAAELDDDADEMETVPMTGWPTDRVYTTFFDAVDYKERVVVIMLDEIDKLVEKSGDDTLYNLSRMNSELDNSRISIMGISNDLKFTDFLDPRVKSSLGEEEIVFPPYDANQLRDILQHRADVAFKPGALTDDVIPLCAAFAAQEHGDARRALDLLRTAGELAERGQADTVEEAHVRQAQDKIELDRVVEVVRTLPTQSKIVLFAIILLEKNGVRNINTGEVFNIYKRLCEEIDADVLTQRRVTDLISELDMLGIVNAVVVSKGRYGRTKEISLSVPIDETEAVLLTDSRLGDIESAQPFVQARFDN